MADGNGGRVTERWYAAAELAGLPGLPGTDRRVRTMAERESWPSRKKAFGKGNEYPLSALPPAAQARLLLRERPVLARSTASPSAWTDDRVAAAWQLYENASDSLKAQAQRRLTALGAVDALCASGMGLMQARAEVSSQLQKENVRSSSVASLQRWAADVAGAPRDAWLAALLPAFVGRTVTAECAPQLWDWYKGHYLVRKGPSHASTYRRAEEMAKAQGWALPSAKTMERRMEREVSRVTQVLLREGPEAAARILPPQRRDAGVFAAGEAVNGDGMKFDKLWVRFADGEILNTATAWFWQDLRTRKILAHRLDKTENTDLFRLATYDLTGVCAPRDVWMDNTRVAANKLMTAGARTRYRFKSDPEDGMGLLLMLGMNPHFTNPDKEIGSPGAKPIERAFGIGGLHSEVATNPRFIDRGYSKATAINEAELREVIVQEVARFNARTGRRTDECRGVLSFDQAWDAAQAERPTRVLAESQRRLLLMSREVVRADKRSGLLSLDAGRGPHGRNRYWCEHLTQYMGQKLAVHFDPDNLATDVHVYSLDGRYLFAAERQATEAFNSTSVGREHTKNKQRLIKANKIAAAAETRMDALERENLYQAAAGLPTPPTRPAKSHGENVVEGHFQRVADPLRDAGKEPFQRTGTDDVREAEFGDLMARLAAKHNAEIGFVPEGNS